MYINDFNFTSKDKRNNKHSPIKAKLINHIAIYFLSLTTTLLFKKKKGEPAPGQRGRQDRRERVRVRLRERGGPGGAQHAQGLFFLKENCRSQCPFLLLAVTAGPVERIVLLLRGSCR